MAEVRLIYLRLLLASLGFRLMGMSPKSNLSLPADKTIAIAVIAGPLKGLTHRLTKPQVSIGHSGSGADIEIDDPAVSPLHCAVGVSGDVVRLCDLESKTGTYVNDKSVQAVELRHLSEFRVGPSLFLLIIRNVDSTRVG